MTKIRKNDLEARKFYCVEYEHLLLYINNRYKIVKKIGDPVRIKAMERLIDKVIELGDKPSYDKD